MNKNIKLARISTGELVIGEYTDSGEIKHPYIIAFAKNVDKIQNGQPLLIPYHHYFSPMFKLSEKEENTVIFPEFILSLTTPAKEFANKYIEVTSNIKIPSKEEVGKIINLNKAKKK